MKKFFSVFVSTLICCIACYAQHPSPSSQTPNPPSSADKYNAEHQHKMSAEKAMHLIPSSARHGSGGNDGVMFRCGTDNHKATRNYSPQEKNTLNRIMQSAQQKIASFMPCNASNSIVIPVAVHYDSGFDCTDEQCLLDAALGNIASMNEDFAALNADISLYNNLNTICPIDFPTDIVSTGTCIQFCLASQNHPAAEGLLDGEPAITVNQYSWTGGADAPNWAGYLNVFISSTTSLLGIAAAPGMANGDGVMINAITWGGPGTACSTGAALNTSQEYNLGRTLTHEVGHYFDLFHPFQGGCADGDMGTFSNPGGSVILDTPPANAPFYGCVNPATATSCGDLPQNACTPNVSQQITNFMDYSDDACLIMFTKDQAAAMNAWATSLTWANNATVCGAMTGIDLTACAISAGFEPVDGSEISVCELNNGIFSFTDTSVSPVAWDWTFTVISGDIALSSTSSFLQNPTVSIVSGTSGTISVLLTVADSDGMTSTTSQSYPVTVQSGDVCICDYRLIITDSFGDGWNGATLDITANGAQVAGAPFGGLGFTSGSFQVYTIPLQSGESISFNHTNGGYPGEEGFILFNSFGEVIFESLSLSSGEALNILSSCRLANCTDVILDEDFEGCTQPPGWMLSSTAGGSVAGGDFIFADQAIPGFISDPPSSTFSGCIAALDDDANDAIGIGCIMSPIIDLAQYTNTHLAFDWQHNAFNSGGNFIVELWDGNMWTPALFVDDDSFGNSFNIELDSYTNSDFQVQFCYDDEGGFQWGAGIDNVSICGTKIVEEIPTVGEWGLIILAMLILIVSIAALRERNEIGDLVR